MRIGIGVPCLTKDMELLFRYCLPSIRRLEPPPDVVLTYINNGHKDGLKGIKTLIYDHLFNCHDVDVILCVDSDMLLFKDILKYIKKDVIVDFHHIVKTPIATMYKIFIRAITNKPLCGCLSIPRKLWFEKIRDNESFNGIDSSIIRSVNSINDFEPKKFPPKFMLMRRSMKQARQDILHHPLNINLGLFRKIIYLLKTIGV